MAERSFGRYSYDDMKKRANSKGGGFDSFIKQQYKVYKVKEGKNLIRILPTPEGSKHFGLPIWVNYGVGPDNGSYLSLSKMLKKPDPLAEALREADREDDEATVKQLRPKQRVLYWLIDRDNPDEGPQLWAAPITFDTDVVNLIIDEDTKEVTYIDDPKTGCDLRFYREKQGEFKVYPASKMKVMGASPLSEDKKESQEWLKYIDDNPLEETLNYYDYEHISQVFNGQSSKKDEPEAEEVPAPRRSARTTNGEDEDPPFDTDDRPARRPRPRLDEPADEDGDAEPAPRRAAAKPRGEDEGEGGSIRDRLRARRRPQAVDEEAD